MQQSVTGYKHKSLVAIMYTFYFELTIGTSKRHFTDNPVVNLGHMTMPWWVEVAYYLGEWASPLLLLLDWMLFDPGEWWLLCRSRSSECIIEKESFSPYVSDSSIQQGEWVKRLV